MQASDSTDQAGTVRASRLTLLLLGLAVLLRVAWPFGSSPTHVDEGGWPLSVRQWATEGLVTFDFHVAPLYHLVLGAVFRLAPPTMMTARLFSVALGLLSLWLLWWAARRILREDRAAAWAVLLWASCFPANEIAGRALIEPLQLAWLLALLAALCAKGRTAIVLTVLTTIGVLLTKANAVVLLPAFAAAVLWDRAPAMGEARRAKLLALAAGTAVSLAVFAGLYLFDPAAFLLGWGETMARAEVETPATALRLGRFAVDPRAIEHGMEFLAGQTPFLFAFGIAGAIRAILAREALAAGLWVALLLPFLLLQAAQSPQYFSVLYPAFAIAAAALLAEAMRRSEGRIRWPEVFLVLVALDGLARTAAAPILSRAPERPAIAWMRANATDGGRVLAAPYILMQLRNPGTSFFTLEPLAYPPDARALQLARPTWFVVDTLEWRHYLTTSGYDTTQVTTFFDACCVREFRDAAIEVFRVRSAASAEPRP